MERKNVQEPNRDPQGIGTIHWVREKPAVRPASLGGRQDECETRVPLRCDSDFIFAETPRQLHLCVMGCLSTPAFPDTHSVALAASRSVLLLFGGLFRCS